MHCGNYIVVEMFDCMQCVYVHYVQNVHMVDIIIYP